MRGKKSNKSGTVPAFGLRGVGSQIAKHLSRLDIHSVQDLLFHLPLHYQDRTRLQTIREAVPGGEAVVEGVITHTGVPGRGRTKLLCEMQDDTGVMYLRFFHVFAFQAGVLKPGTRLRCYGEVRLGPQGKEMFHPEYQAIEEGVQLPVDQHLTPVYPATEGLNQRMLRKLTSNALTAAGHQQLPELLPAHLLQSLSFPTLKEALQFVHRPPRETLIAHLEENNTPAQKRLIFEELLAHRISLLHVKHRFQSLRSAQLLKSAELAQAFRSVLPFSLTAAQERVVSEIADDLVRPFPMLRLVQGDVGSGKTVIAALAMLQAAANNFQAAMMAPTELLAEQHHRVFSKWLEPMGVKLVFLSGNVKAAARKSALAAISSGEAQIILGTHALFQAGVDFSRLALVIVDEQHRFGVHQRALFREKGSQDGVYPHQLVMTATPIPRTLAMSFYADLDCSVIDELPPGRTPVTTSLIAASRRDEVIARIHDACAQGRQAYWVCPLIEESEVIACQAATRTAEELRTVLRDLRIGLIHGRMNAADKDEVMREFQQGHTHILVATTVIEVGVDVPNASVMVIENAERMGLSQLHQLRGRVGRGSVASHCLLLYQHPLSSLARERLAVMRETTDGFRIAQRDLELRGPGEVLGTRQTGELSFRVADLLRDNEMLPQVQQAAEIILRQHPEVIEPLVKRWLGRSEQYGKV